MKGISLKGKITLWFSAIIILITVIVFSVILLISREAVFTNVKETLSNIVAANVEELEYHVDDNIEYEIGDHYIEYKNGLIEIDDDFLNESQGVHTALFDKSGELLYGENMIDASISENGNIFKMRYNNQNYYVLNIFLSDNNLNGLVLQGIVNENANETVLTRIVKFSLMILPVLALIAILGGYFLSGRLLSPIRSIAQSAESISDGNDLSKRIIVDKNKGELYSLAEAFNRMFDRLEVSFEEEKQFTSDISHELRTPVSSILAQCELALDKERTGGEYRKALSVIGRQSYRMKKIVEDMLSFSRLERLEKLPNPTTVNLSELLSDIAEEQQVRSINNISVATDIDSGIFVEADVDLLAAMINNLITNAFRYGRENGNIILSLKLNDGNAILSVTDDGIGIDSSKIDKIFNRFYREDRVRNSSDSSYGLGLGLPAALAIAKLHGGSLSAQSKLGEGSTFIFKISAK